MSGLPQAGQQERNCVPNDHNDYLKQAYETCLPHDQVLHQQKLRMTR